MTNMKPTKHHKVTKRDLAEALRSVIDVETQNRKLVLVFSNPEIRDDTRRVVLDFLGLGTI